MELRKILMTPGTIPHELCHYLAARLLGVEADFGLDQVDVYTASEDDWRLVPILLAPIAIGFLGQALVLWFSRKHRYFWQINLSALLANVAWQHACQGDYRDLWRYLSKVSRG